MLTQLENDYPSEPLSYFLTRWWLNGQCERWAEVHIRKHPNLGISSTSQVEGSHGAMKGGLTSSSGNLSTAGNKIIHRESQHPELKREFARTAGRSKPVRTIPLSIMS
ncbi:hypothetical protein V1527DRAFT_331310 [Lipomyces starkeyi]